MKIPIFLLTTAGAFGLALATPDEARAGGLHVDIHLGVPAVVYRPHVIYAPAVVYHPRTVYRPYVRHRHHQVRHHHRHYRHHYRYDRHHVWAYEQRAIGKIGLNPRLHPR